MVKQSLLYQLEMELSDIPTEVISEIIDLRIADPRISQKSIVEQFEIPKASVKKIIDRMKQCNISKDSDCTTSTVVNEYSNGSDSDMNAEKTKAGAKSVDDTFSSINELMQFCNSARSSRAGTPSGPGACSLSLMNLLDDDGMDDQSKGITKENTKSLNDGDELINHVKWFVDSAAKEITSLRQDQELFEAEKNGLREQISKANQKISELTAELETANAARKSNVCSRCDGAKTLNLRGINFCSVECIKKTYNDLHGAEKLPTNLNLIADA